MSSINRQYNAEHEAQIIDIAENNLDVIREVCPNKEQSTW